MPDRAVTGLAIPAALSSIRTKVFAGLGIATLLTIAGLSIALTLTRARLHSVRIADQLAEQMRRADAAADEAAWAVASATAASNYAARLADREPVILRSHDTVTQYAQTPAGHAPCLAADRVRGIDDLDAALARPPRSGAGAVHDPAGPPAE